MKKLDQNILSELIETTYRTALDDDSWSCLFDLMRRVTGVEHFVLQGFDLNLGSKDIAALYGYDDSFTQAYVEHYWKKNPWLPGIARSPIGQSVAAELYCSERKLRQGEFYNDLVKKHDDVGTGGGIVLYRDDTRFLAVGGNIKIRHRDALQNDWLRLLNILSPHLRNAFEMRRKLSGQRISDSGYISAIDAIENPVFLLTSSGRIAHANPRGLGLLVQDFGLFLDPHRILRFKDPRADKLLCSTVLEISKKHTLSVTRQFEVRSRDGVPLALATLSPFCPDPSRIDLFADFISQDLPVAIMALAVAKPESIIDTKIMATMFGLTPAEAALAGALAGGTSLNEYAEGRGLSRNTVRNQLRAVYAKTDTNRQGQLVALIARLTGGSGHLR